MSKEKNDLPLATAVEMVESENYLGIVEESLRNDPDVSLEEVDNIIHCLDKCVDVAKVVKELM